MCDANSSNIMLLTERRKVADLKGNPALNFAIYIREREMFYSTTHSTHFIYGYMASDIWLRTILIVRKETRCRHIGYSYRLTARVLLYAPSHRQDNTYHGLCYTSHGALAGTRNSSMGTIYIRNLPNIPLEDVGDLCHILLAPPPPPPKKKRRKKKEEDIHRESRWHINRFDIETCLNKITYCM